MDIREDLRAMACGLASVADAGDQHCECLLLREAVRLLDEAEKFIEGFAASGESGFTRQRAAQAWCRALHDGVKYPAAQTGEDS